MNVNYIGSFAEQNMMFRSSVDVVEVVSNEPFHCLEGFFGYLFPKSWHFASHFALRVETSTDVLRCANAIVRGLDTQLSAEVSTPRTRNSLSVRFLA